MRVGQASWIVALLMSACVHIPPREARLEYVSPVGELPRHVISLSALTGNWGFSGHSMSAYREFQWVSIQLPFAPGELTRFDAQQVKVVEQSYPPKPLPVASGFVEVDRKHESVVVELQTTDGPLWVNGSYPLR